MNFSVQLQSLNALLEALRELIEQHNAELNPVNSNSTDSSSTTSSDSLSLVETANNSSTLPESDNSASTQEFTDFTSTSDGFSTKPTSSAINGNILTVTTLNDENDGGTAGTGLSLRDAVLYALAHQNQTFEIHLQAGQTYTLDIDGIDEYWSMTGDLNIDDLNLTIKTVGQGEDAIIDGSGLNQDRIFRVRDSALTLDNVTVTGGNYTTGLGKGGAIQAFRSTLNLFDSTLENNTGLEGGAVWAQDSQINAQDSAFKDNTALYYSGGAVFITETGFNQSTVNVNNSFFSGNKGDNGEKGAGIAAHNGVAITVTGSTFENHLGSAIYTVGENSDRTTLTIDNSNFINNHSLDPSLGGGAVYIEQGDATITDSDFSSNYALNRGGAIHVRDYSNLEVSDASFTNNSAGEAGGAIASHNQSDVDINHVDFIGNQARSGGALDIIGNLTIDDALFQQNHTLDMGGAIHLSLGYANSSGSLLHESHVTNVEFIENTSDGGAGAVRIGGSAGNQSFWDNIQFINNIAYGTNSNHLHNGKGGAVFITGGQHEFNNINADGNEAELGGSFHISGLNNATIVDINQSTIQNGNATSGGGIYAISNTYGITHLNLFHVEGVNNFAGFAGGFLRAIDGIIVHGEDSNISNNTAAGPDGGGGGGFSLEGSEATVINIAITDNEGYFGGGGFRVGAGRFLPSPGKLYLYDSLVHGNRASGSEGGGVLIQPHGEAEIVGSIFSENLAAINGAAIYAEASLGFSPAAKLDVRNSTITRSGVDSNDNGSGDYAIYAVPENLNLNFPRYAAEVTLYNNIISDTIKGQANPTVGFDLGGATPLAAEYNLIENPDDDLLLSNTNIVGVDPQLFEYGDGVYAFLSASSPAFNQGSAEFLPLDELDFDGDGITNEPLPLDYFGNDRVIGQLDIGATELQPIDGGGIPV